MSCPITEISFYLYQIQLSRQLSLLKEKFVVSSNAGNVSEKKILMLLINFHFLICPCFLIIYHHNQFNINLVLTYLKRTRLGINQNLVVVTAEIQSHVILARDAFT